MRIPALPPFIVATAVAAALAAAAPAAARVPSGAWSGRDATGARVALKVTSDGRKVARFAPASAPYGCPDGQQGTLSGLSLDFPMKIARDGKFSDRDISGDAILIVSGKISRRRAVGTYIAATTIGGQVCSSPKVPWTATPGAKS